MPTEEAQQIEDLTAALGKAEAQAEKYRKALVHIDQLATFGLPNALMARTQQIVRDAIWTPTENCMDRGAGW
jgi:hypothetical protein